MLFQVLREHAELGSLPTEGHNIWRRFHHPRKARWRSDHVSSGQVGIGERRYVNAHFFAYAGRKRLLDKTADNLVRVRYLLELFPDAIFVVMKRNPCDAVNSYVNMWGQPGGRFRSYYVPTDLAIPDYPQRRMWCSTLIDGWRELTTAPIPEIAFEQWRQYLNGIEEGRRSAPPEQWVEFFLEDLLEHPAATSRWLFDRLGLKSTPEVARKLSDLLAHPINSISPPANEKWRRENPAAIQDLLPRISERAPVLGCSIDPITGAFSYDGISQPKPSVGFRAATDLLV
jgi:hypothetical protein